jgi:hypothetical protein
MHAYTFQWSKVSKNEKVSRFFSIQWSKTTWNLPPSSFRNETSFSKFKIDLLR